MAAPGVVHGVEEDIGNALRSLIRESSHSPAYFREYIRKNHALQMIDFLAAVANGETRHMEVQIVENGGMRAQGGGGQRVEVAMVEAPAAVRVTAARVVLEHGIPRQVGIEGLGGPKTGIIALPMPALLYAQQHGEHFSGELPPHPDGLEYVIVEEDLAVVHEAAVGNTGPDAPPPPVTGNLNPDMVAELRAMARAKVAQEQG